MAKKEMPVLSIRNLKTYFYFGRGKNKFVVKAIDDVSFDIYKGEVFGLVGESGCGKTTTGRTIIKLHDPTDGEVYFLGERIGAGILGNKEKIKEIRKETRIKLSEMKVEEAIAIKEASPEELEDVKENYKKKIKEIRDNKSRIIAEQKEDMILRKESLIPKYDLMRNMQMIFQDPIASLNPRMTVKEIIAEGLRIAGNSEYKLAIKNAIDDAKKSTTELRVEAHPYLGAEIELKEKITGIKEDSKKKLKSLKLDKKLAVKAPSLKVKEDFKKKFKKAKNDKEKLAELKAEKVEAKKAASEEVIKIKEDFMKKNQDVKDSKVKEIAKQTEASNKKITSLKAEDYKHKALQDVLKEKIREVNNKKKEIIATNKNTERLINQKVNDVLETVGLLPEHASRYPHEFSGGQRQRIGIARALIVAPKFIIADEPISALDVSIQAQVINLLNDLRDNLGITIMFIAHDLSVIKYFSDRIGVMYYGNLVELTTSDELFLNPLHPYTRSLLSAVPLPDPRYEKTRQRIIYKPAEVHDYKEDKPSLQEIKKGHFVYANDAEMKEYRKGLK